MSTYPLILDDAFQLTIGDLSKWGYLIRGNYDSGSITWTRTSAFGDVCRKSSVSIFANLSEDPEYIQLDYSCGGKSISTRIFLQFLQSNLGADKGMVPYFLCPVTCKRCRKLYLIDGYFMSRYAVPTAMYESQTQSKKYRFIEKHYGDYFKADKAYQTINQKHFRKFYSGKPTKKYLKLLSVIDEANSYSADEIEAMYLM